MLFERLCCRHIVSQEKEKKILQEKKNTSCKICAQLCTAVLYSPYGVLVPNGFTHHGLNPSLCCFPRWCVRFSLLGKFMAKESNLVFPIKRSGPVEVAVQWRGVALCYCIGHCMFLEPSVLFVKPLFRISSCICLGFSFLMCILGSLPSRTIVNSIVL